MKNAHLECGIEVDDKVPKNSLLYFCILLYHTCIYNRFPEDEPSVSIQVEDIKKIKN